MKLYRVKHLETDEYIGSNSKKFFMGIGHIKTLRVWDLIIKNEAIIEEYDLSEIKPKIITYDDYSNSRK